MKQKFAVAHHQIQQLKDEIENKSRALATNHHALSQTNKELLNANKDI